MRGRKLRWVLVGLAALAVEVAFLWPRSNRITQENFELISGGMSRAEVEAILGPPGDYRSAPTTLYYMSVWWPDEGAYWQTDDATYLVIYDEENRQVLHHNSLNVRGQPKLSLIASAIWNIKRIFRHYSPGKPTAPPIG